MFICTPAQMKIAEANAAEKGDTYIGLMEKAGAACAQEILRRRDAAGKNVLILCGKGGNGGDGFVIARLLSEAGAKVTAALMCGKPSGIALEEMEKLSDTDVKIVDGGDIAFSVSYSVIADAVYGTGFHGELPENVRDIFSRLDDLPAFKIAVDIPSGANAITGEISDGTMSFDVTVALGALKTGHKLSPAKDRCGQIVTADIGISDGCFEAIGYVPRLMDEKTAAAAIPPRTEHSHKGSFGRLLIIAGSRDMSGAAALNVTGALRSGAGLVRLAAVKNVIDRVGGGIYECTFTELEENESGAISASDRDLHELMNAAGNSTAVTIGSGLTVCDDTKRITEEMIKYCGEHNIPLIIDADGLNCLGSSIDIIRNANCRAVLTPHVGELSRMLGTDTRTVLSDRLSAAAKAAEITGAVVVAKGMPTYIVSPDGRAYASFTGNGGLSRGGSGDVLTGIISGICSSNLGEHIFGSACAGTYIFGLAADLAADKLSMTGMLPSDAAAQLPFAFKIIEKYLSE